MITPKQSSELLTFPIDCRDLRVGLDGSFKRITSSFPLSELTSLILEVLEAVSQL